MAITLRRLEARLPDRFECFFIETGPAALGDFSFRDMSLGINFDSQPDITLQSGPQGHRGIVGPHGLHRLCFTADPSRRSGQSGRACTLALA
jgi:hypothetical protein